jgi:hypothetical protein
MSMAGVLLVVLIGFAALAIDVGALYQERRELQNGADAAALAIAEDCGRATAPCDSATAGATAELYADDNSDDDLSAVDTVDLDPLAKTVSVVTSTEEIGGGTILAPALAQVLGWNGTTVHGSAAAAWGYPAGLHTLPLIISDCEWNDPTRPLLQTEPPFVGDPWIFTFHDGHHGRTCGHGPSGFDLPGGFGWLDTFAGLCAADTEEGGWIGADPGSSPANGCTPELIRAQILDQVVYLPYYDDLTGTGNNDEYRVSAFGAFWVTGYNFGGGYKEPPGNVPCGGAERCLAGYFVEATAYDGDLGGTDRGLVLVKLTG